MIKMNGDMIVFQEEETYVAYCPDLDLSIYGNSVPHAKEMFRTAIRLFLEEAEKPGTLDDILSEVRYTVNPYGRYVPREKNKDWYKDTGFRIP